MQLLDASLAFALTLAALATVVTIIMETVVRVCRMRKKNLLQLAELLNEELRDGPLKMGPEERWKFITGAIRNPALAIADAAAETQNSAKLKDQHKKMRLGDIGTRFFGTDLYDKVSLEHVLRRLAELPSVQGLSRDASKAAVTELNRLARKFEEFGSAVSAKFKRRAEIWSIVIGILLAVFANIEGLRIFNAYLTDETLRQTIIDKQADLEKAHSETQQRIDTLNEKTIAVENARKALDDARSPTKEDVAAPENDAAAAPEEGAAAAPEEGAATAAEIEGLKTALRAAEGALAAETSPEAIKAVTLKAQAQLTNVEALGVPIGWSFYPACPYGNDDEGAWRDGDAECRVIFEIHKSCFSKSDQMGSDGSGSDDIGRTDTGSDTNDSENTGSAQIDSSETDQIDCSFFMPKPTASSLDRIWSSLKIDPYGFFKWLFVVTLTGLLIGLGAPFWFDVAKRLAQVRQLFGGAGSGETRMAGGDATGADPQAKAEARDQIVKKVVEDAKATAPPPSTTVSPPSA